MAQLKQRLLAAGVLLSLSLGVLATPEIGEVERDNAVASEVVTLSVYEDCVQALESPGGQLASLREEGLINSSADIDTICACASDTILTSLASESSTRAAKAATQKGMAQCLAPYVGRAAETMCLTARDDGSNTMSVAQCECFGKQVDLRVTSHPLSFFKHPGNYVKSAGLYCERTVR